jgi:ATPase subunit of ABC transporter with duplicated ATPase domains
LEDVETTAANVLKGLGFSSKRMQQPFNTLSGGWKMRCQLASALIQPADLMLLDEATNYLDLSGIVWLERYIQKINETHGTTIVIVSHDRDFLNNICEETIILRDCKLEYFKGNLAAYMEDREAQKLDRIRKKDASERQKAHFQNTIAENIKQGKKTGDDNRLQQAKSRKKRVEERTGLQVSAKGHRFKFTRDAGGKQKLNSKSIVTPTHNFSQGLAGGKKRHEITLIRDDKQILIEFPLAAELRFPGPLISAEKISFSYAKGQTPVLEDVTLHIRLGDRIGILGLNGSGKTTLIKNLVRDLNPTKGSVTHHPRAKIGWYTQHIVEDLRAQGQSNPNLTALQILSSITESMTEGELRGLLSSFGLRGDLASDVPIAKLSGGQLVSHVHVIQIMIQRG